MSTVEAEVSDAPVTAPEPPDSEHPAWRIAGAAVVWLVHIASMLLFPLIFLLAWFYLANVRGGAQLSAAQFAKQFEGWVLSPQATLANLLSIYVAAHPATLVVSYLVVTGFGRRPFLASLDSGNRVYSGKALARDAALAFAVCVLALLLTNEPADPSKIAGLSVMTWPARLLLGLLAVVTSPLIEEIVYRGVIYPALRSRVGVWAAATVVTVLYALILMPQYWGDNSALAMIFVLSVSLTLTRALTKSLKRSVYVHVLYNLGLMISITFTGQRTAAVIGEVAAAFLVVTLAVSATGVLSGPANPSPKTESES